MFNRPLACYGFLFLLLVEGLKAREIEREKFERLVEYYEENGATLNAFMDYNENGIRGLFASKTFKNGDIILSIPHDLSFRCKSRTDYHCLFEFAPVLSKHIETNGGTRYSDYIDLMPSLEYFKQTRVYFLPEDILQDFEILLPIARLELGQKRNSFQNVPPLGEYAWNLILSRSFHFKESGGVTRTWMVGIMDLVNHDIERQNVKTWFNSTHWSCKATKPIQQYEELLLLYMKNVDSLAFVRAFGFYEEHAPVKLSSLQYEACLEASRLFKKYSSNEYEEHRRKLNLLFALYKERCGKFEVKDEQSSCEREQRSCERESTDDSFMLQ